MMRVAYITSQAVSAAGWGRYTVEVVKGARERGIEPVLITPDSAVDPALQDVEIHPILPQVLAARLFTPRSLLKAPQLRRILKTCDAVHCIVELYAPLVALAAPRRMPFILSVFGTWAIRPLESRAQRLFFAPAFQRADKILSISGFTKDWMQKLIRLDTIEVLAGGVHPEKFQISVDDIDLPPWLGAEPTLLSVGAVKARKGQDVAIEALPMVKEHFPNVHYAMAGNDAEDPEFTAGLRRRVEALGLQDNVHFLGQLPPYSTLVAWYQKADLFVLPSTNQGSSFEGLGFVFLEAAAAGTPSVGTLDCGAMEAIQHGETGLLVPQRAPQATAEAIIQLLHDKALRDKMAAAAPTHAERLSWGNLVDRVVWHYKNLKRG